MSISKAKILSSFIEYPIPKNLITKETFNYEALLLSTQSLHPTASSDKNGPQFSKAFVPSSEGQKHSGWRTNNNNYHNQNNLGFHPHQPYQNRPNEFSRGQNFQPKEPLIDIEVENILLFNEKFNFPKDKKSFYFQNKSSNFFFGPLSANTAIEYYKKKTLDSSFDFRPIDIFGFKNLEPFEFLPLKELNNKDWINQLVDSPLLCLTNVAKTAADLEKKVKNLELEKENSKKKEAVKPEKPEKQEQAIEKEIDNKSIEAPKEEEESEKETPKKEENLQSFVKHEEGKWEDPNKKKRKVRPGQKPSAGPSNPVGISKKEEKIKTMATQPKEVVKVDNDDELLDKLRPKKEEKKEEKPKPIEGDGFEEVKSSKKVRKKKRPHETSSIPVGFKY